MCFVFIYFCILLCTGIRKRAPFCSCQVPCDCDCCLNKTRKVASFSLSCFVSCFITWSIAQAASKWSCAQFCMYLSQCSAIIQVYQGKDMNSTESSSHTQSTWFKFKFLEETGAKTAKTSMSLSHEKNNKKKKNGRKAIKTYRTRPEA